MKLNQKKEVLIVSYHYVRPRENFPFADFHALTVDDFIDQVEMLASEYTPIGFDVLQDSLKGDVGQLPQRSVLLTFDDGYKDHLDFVYPVLKERGIKGVFFLSASATRDRKLLDVNKIQYIRSAFDSNSDLISQIDEAVRNGGTENDLLTVDEYRQLYWKQVRYNSPELTYLKRMLQTGLPTLFRQKLIDKLFRYYVGSDELALAEELYMNIEDARVLHRSGMEIGGHGRDHLRLDNVSESIQQAEISSSANLLELVFGESPKNWSFCYPHGVRQASTAELLKESGCTIAFSSEPRICTPGSDDPLFLPRLNPKDLVPALN